MKNTTGRFKTILLTTDFSETSLYAFPPALLIAEERGVDLIVIATHGRGFISHALFGSTTERVVRRALCPVLTVRAHGPEDQP